jgi:hypothetical protein
VKRTDHGAKLVGWTAERLVRSVAPVGRKEGERRVTPVVRVGLGLVVGVVLRLVDREQLDGGHAERRQRSGLGGGAGVRAAQRGGHRRIVHREPAQVHFVDDVVLERTRRLGPRTRRVRGQRDRLGRDGRVVDRAVVATHVRRAGKLAGLERVVAHLTRIGIDEELVGIESVAEGIDVRDEAHARARRPRRVVGPVRPPGAVAVEVRRGQPARLQRGVGDVGAPRRRPCRSGHRDGKSAPDTGVGREQLRLHARGGVGSHAEVERIGAERCPERAGAGVRFAVGIAGVANRPRIGQCHRCIRDGVRRRTVRRARIHRVGADAAGREHQQERSQAPHDSLAQHGTGPIPHALRDAVVVIRDCRRPRAYLHGPGARGELDRAASAPQEKEL